MSLIDVAPTILDLLGLAGAEDMEGRSLMPLIRGEEGDRPAFAETYYGNRLVALRLGNMKYIFTPPPPEGGWPRSDGWKSYWPNETREEVYDLERDPEEQRSIASAEDDVVRSMRHRLLSWLSEQQERANARPTDHLIGRAIEEQLRSLGYLD